MVKRNHHGAHDNTKKDVGGQPGQVSPTIDQLPSISDTCHLDIEAYHHIPPLFSKRIFYSTKTQQPPAEGGLVTPPISADIQLRGIAMNYPVSFPRSTVSATRDVSLVYHWRRVP